MTLTKKQKLLFDYLDDHIVRHGYAPTLEEIGEHFSLSSLATVHKHLKNLEEKGLIRRRENHSRAIEIVDSEPEARAVCLPLLGQVAAGAPIEAIEDDQEITVPADLVRRRGSFALRVSGRSMIEDGILDGDFIVVEPNPSPDNGDTVVALVDGGATVKRFYREEDGHVRLQPANAAMEPILVHGGDLEVRGTVTAVLRRYR